MWVRPSGAARIARALTAFAIGCFGAYHEIQGPLDRPFIFYGCILMIILPVGELADYLRSRGGDK